MARSVFLRKIEDKFRYILSKINKGYVKITEIKKGKIYEIKFFLKENEYFYRKDSEEFWALLSSLAKHYGFYYKRIGKKKEHQGKHHYRIIVSKRWLVFLAFLL